MAVIREGRIGQFDTPQDLYEQPADPGLARFFGDANLVPGVVAGTEVTTALGLLPVSGPVPGPGRAAVVLVRPEQTRADPHPGRRPAHRAWWWSYEYYGHDAVVRVRPDTGRLVPRPWWPGSTGARPGRRGPASG